MREILFRGKNDKGEWAKGYYVETLRYNNLHWIWDGKEHIKIIPETVGQYTGLTDRNGTKIFEGDICKHRSNYSGNFIISVVTYTDGCFLAMADNNSGFNLSEKLEIIGNIHDNPELMKREMGVEI